MLGWRCCSSGMCHSSWADSATPNPAWEKEGEPGNPWGIFTQESKQGQRWFSGRYLSGSSPPGRNSRRFSSSSSSGIPFLSGVLVEGLWDPRLGAPHAQCCRLWSLLGLRIGLQDLWDSFSGMCPVPSIHQLIQDGKVGWKQGDFHPTWISQGIISQGFGEGENPKVLHWGDPRCHLCPQNVAQGPCVASPSPAQSQVAPSLGSLLSSWEFGEFQQNQVKNHS